MDITTKFEAGKVGKTYRRIDSDYKTNIFLGYNENGEMSMVITEFGKEVTVKSSKLICVSLCKREDKKLALSFDLLDDTYRQLFIIFCKDIIATCEKAGTDMAISSAIIRWNYWKELFGRRNNNILDNLSIKGLLGELIELKNFFMPLYGQEKAIYSWMGPLLGHKDFEIEDTWYEVKSITENAIQVTINSLEQLESEYQGHLVVVRLEDTAISNDKSLNLNQIVYDIASTIKDPETLELFMTKLSNYGYETCEEYNMHNYMYYGAVRYTVSDNFPRILRSEIPESIGNVKYTIMLNSIESFKEG